MKDSNAQRSSHSITRRSDPDNLTPRQRRFAENYIATLNATDAALKAGFGRKWAHTAGSQLLKNIKVAAVIQKAQRKLSARTEVSAERVINKLAEIAFSETDPQLPKPSDQLNALQQLGRHLGLFVERHQVDTRARILSASVSPQDLEDARRLVAEFTTKPPLQIEGTVSKPDTESGNEG
ncbi:MAG: terminase small subunit [Hyphomicrobiales bacterium]|nr:terminase small subunit [Hyphomicrobiales bacterium]